MSGPSKPFKVGAVVWSIVLAVALIALGVSVILPSTKRARIHLNQLGEDPENVGSGDSATPPSTQP